MGLRIVMVFLIAAFLSSCAFHKGKFPYICFRRGCVKNQFDIDGKMHAIKLNRSKREKRRRKRRGSAERDKAKDRISAYEPGHKETREERAVRRKAEKAARGKEEEKRVQLEDSLYLVRHAKQQLDLTSGKQERSDTLFIFFEPGSDSISTADAERIQSFVSKNKKDQLQMIGSMDDSEGQANTGLSSQRIKNVFREMQSAGASKNKISKIDAGAVPSTTDAPIEEQKRANRKVMLITK